MQSLPGNHPFRLHSENLRATRDGLVQAERSHKSAIRRNDAAETEFAARVHQLMVAIAAEAHLRKIIADPGGFNEIERKLIARVKSQSERWKLVVELAFRRHYKVLLHQAVDAQSVSAAVAGQFQSLIVMIENDLGPVIGDRNKIAHAQWRWMLNSKEETFTGPTPVPLNYLQLHRRSKIVHHLASLVYVLSVSESTFQRDYDHHFAMIVEMRAALNLNDYGDFADELRQRKKKVATTEFQTNEPSE